MSPVLLSGFWQVDELYEAYCIQRRLQDGASKMKLAFATSPASRVARESLSEINRSYKEYTEVRAKLLRGWALPGLIGIVGTCQEPGEWQPTTSFYPLERDALPFTCLAFSWAIGGIILNNSWVILWVVFLFRAFCGLQSMWFSQSCGHHQSVIPLLVLL